MKDYETEIFIEDIHKFWIKGPIQVIHCGAHLAEEASEYYANNFKPVIWIEAVPDLIPVLTGIVNKYSDDSVIQAALWSKSGVNKVLRIANNSYSSSMREFGTHKNTYPDIDFISEISVNTITLDEIGISKAKRYLLVMDLQGIEFEVLLGAIEVLKSCEFVYLEISKRELYSGQAIWDQVSDFLATQGFKLVDWQYSEKVGWGNALYSSKIQHLGRIRRWLRLRKHSSRILGNK